MMDWIAAALLAVGFILLLKLFKVIDVSRDVLTLSRTVTSIISDKSISELEKEKAMQKHSLDFFRYFLVILLGSAAALAVPFGLVWLFARSGMVSLENTLTITISWQFLLGTLVLGSAAFYAFGRS
ncbi:MAG TPA: hypothetical protein VFM46_05120, partial [Pseudomonadales bacterium]|nr:hypothetical protein [Pseudomonadales bacterium]